MSPKANAYEIMNGWMDVWMVGWNMLQQLQGMERFFSPSAFHGERTTSEGYIRWQGRRTTICLHLHFMINPLNNVLCLSWTALKRNDSMSIELPKAARAFRATVRVLWRGWRGILCAAEYIKNDPFKSDTWWLSDVRVSASEAALPTAVAARMNQKWAVNARNKSTWLSNLLFKYNQQRFIAAKVKPTCG